MKQCIECKEIKKESDFHKRSLCKDGLNQRCKICITRYSRAWYHANPEKSRQYAINKNSYPEYERERYLKRRYSKYGLTKEIFDQIVITQDGKCAICKKVPQIGFRVDHDHSCCPKESSCGKCVRGLLCEKCNPALGSFDDDIEVLRAAILYLERYNQMIGVR